MNFYQQLFFLLAGVFGASAIGAGAFGAHLMKGKFSLDLLDTFEVAVRYQMYHALALLILAGLLAVSSSSALHAAGLFFIGGTIIFSGSLYILVLSGIKAWGAVTPVGGVLLILGWLSLITAALRSV
jgi:uncharacterized membrane protein YgdD (TMEM256/DUF423 family)